MTRSILLPLLGLGAIILFGTTRAARPSMDVPAPSPPERVEIATPEPLLRAPVADPTPPPAPRLRSETDTDSAEPDSADAEPDSADAIGGSGSVPLSVEHEPFEDDER